MIPISSKYLHIPHLKINNIAKSPLIICNFTKSPLIVNKQMRGEYVDLGNLAIDLTLAPIKIGEYVGFMLRWAECCENVDI